MILQSRRQERQERQRRRQAPRSSIVVVLLMMMMISLMLYCNDDSVGVNAAAAANIIDLDGGRSPNEDSGISTTSLSPPPGNDNDNNNNNNKKNNKIQTFHLHPTTQIEHLKQIGYDNDDEYDDDEEETDGDSNRQRRRDLRELLPKNWFHQRYKYNSIYATLPKQDELNLMRTDDNNATKNLHEEFHSLRHLSRYERQHRIQQNIDLQYNWNGIYTTITAIAASSDASDSDSDASLSSFDDSNKNNSSPSTVVQQQQQNNNTFLLRRKLQQEQEQEQRRYAHENYNYQYTPLSQGYGTHYAHAWIGSPIPQRKSVIVDTGSHYTAFPCKGCYNCGEEHHTDPYYDPDSSSTFHIVQCAECRMGAACSTAKHYGDNDKKKKKRKDAPYSTIQDKYNQEALKVQNYNKRCIFSQSYTEGSSWDAYQVIDNFYVAGNDILSSVNPVDSYKYTIPFMFGCQTSASGLFVTQLADGIMGMSAHDLTLPKQMYIQEKIQHNMFTLCFKREFATSKKGVTAGFMTFGGIDNRLDTSPMVYAVNTAYSGWYTVYVKNIFIRTNGGQSATSITEDGQHIMKIPLDINEINSGKGVIVDSGTTDTYLNEKLAASFTAVWKQITGHKDYTHTPISLTEKQLMSLPTILIQIKAHKDTKNYYNNNKKDNGVRGSGNADDPFMNENTIGLVGKLDPYNPNDILLAIPATNYMEYSQQSNTYTSRLYFTETSGGVLGANAMQGHNVLFDWENGRVGFAESTCEFIDKNNNKDGNIEQGGGIGGEVGDDRGNNDDDCILSKPPIVSQSCIQSVDVNECINNNLSDDAVLKGVEKLTMVVMNTGLQPSSSGSSMSCRDAALIDSTYTGAEPPTVDCTDSGLCIETRPCQVTCGAAKAANKLIGAPPPEVEEYNKQQQAQHLATSPGSDNIIPCGEVSLWGSCTHACTQSRLSSVLMSDGKCHESSRESRPCHINDCNGQSDPCRVPFIVHAIFVFRGAGIEHMYNTKYGEVFASALSLTVKESQTGYANSIFEDGDVNVLMAIPWYSDAPSTTDSMVDDSATTSTDENVNDNNNKKEQLGLKMVVEISIFNKNAKEKGSSSSGSKEGGKEKSTTTATTTTTCEQSDLFSLAKNAITLHGAFGKENFMESLTNSMKRYEVENRHNVNISPFLPLYNQRELAVQSMVVSSWTINTEVDEQIDTLMKSLSNKIRIVIGVVVLLIVCCILGIYIGYKCGVIIVLGPNEMHVIEKIQKLTGLSIPSSWYADNRGVNLDDDDNGDNRTTNTDDDDSYLDRMLLSPENSTASGAISVTSLEPVGGGNDNDETAVFFKNRKKTPPPASAAAAGGGGGAGRKQRQGKPTLTSRRKGSGGL